MNSVEFVREDLFKSLMNLVKFNEGNFKSLKQAKFFKEYKSQQALNDFNPEALSLKKLMEETDFDITEDEFSIKIDARFNFGGKGGRGLRPVNWFFKCDMYGIQKVVKVTHTHKENEQGKIVAYPVNKVIVEWERPEDWEEPYNIKEEEENIPVSNFVGDIGDRLERTVNFVGRHDFKTEDYFGRVIDKYIYKFQDKEGNLFVWFTKSFKLLEKNEELNLRMTLKEHNEYRGTKQNIVKRVHIEDYDDYERSEKARKGELNL